MNAESVLIGDSPVIRQLRRTIARVAPSSLPVLVEGPTGTGKELVASLLHEMSGRRGAFVAFNVCAIADTMFEDSVFGHVRGAFTGAQHDSAGFFREAHGGTVFLDEIGGLALAAQAKLLRALETGTFRPIGSARDTRSDFRPVAATNEGIEQLVAVGRFRSDLAHRLSGVVVTLPSLDRRRGDIPMLVSHFARGRPVGADAIEMLERLPWPGNVRELRQVVDAAGVFARGTIDGEAVRLALAHRSRSMAPPPARAIHARRIEKEKGRLLAALERESWNTERAARALGVHRSTLYRRLKRWEIPLLPR